jgi:hypothetical protein
MADEILVDTNVLVYAYDRAEPRKQKQALETMRRLVASGRGKLSAHSLAFGILACSAAAGQGRYTSAPHFSPTARLLAMFFGPSPR